MIEIPKIIHQIWSGLDEPLPKYFKSLGETWKENHPNHPNWKYEFWDNNRMNLYRYFGSRLRQSNPEKFRTQMTRTAQIIADFLFIIRIICIICVPFLPLNPSKEDFCGSECMVNWLPVAGLPFTFCPILSLFPYYQAQQCYDYSSCNPPDM
jgi:hypothetical protein